MAIERHHWRCLSRDDTNFSGHWSRLLSRVLPDRLQQPVASLRTTLVDLDQRLVNQMCQQIEHMFGRDVGSRTDGLGGVELATAGKHRQPSQDDSLRFHQQVVAPVERRAQAVLTFRGRPCAFSQEAQRIVEPLIDLFECQHTNPSRGKLDRER